MSESLLRKPMARKVTLILSNTESPGYNIFNRACSYDSDHLRQIVITDLLRYQSIIDEKKEELKEFTWDEISLLAKILWNYPLGVGDRSFIKATAEYIRKHGERLAKESEAPSVTQDWTLEDIDIGTLAQKVEDLSLPGFWALVEMMEFRIALECDPEKTYTWWDAFRDSLPSVFGFGKKADKHNGEK